MNKHTLKDLILHAEEEGLATAEETAQDLYMVEEFGIANVEGTVEELICLLKILREFIRLAEEEDSDDAYINAEA